MTDGPPVSGEPPRAFDCDHPGPADKPCAVCGIGPQEWPDDDRAEGDIAALDVERLTAALIEVDIEKAIEDAGIAWWTLPPRTLAERIAAESARLTSKEKQP